MMPVYWLLKEITLQFNLCDRRIICPSYAMHKDTSDENRKTWHYSFPRKQNLHNSVFFTKEPCLIERLQAPIKLNSLVLLSASRNLKDFCKLRLLLLTLKKTLKFDFIDAILWKGTVIMGIPLTHIA